MRENCCRRISFRARIEILPLIVILAVLFPSIWFVDLIFSGEDGRNAKMLAWALVMFLAAASAAYRVWVKQNPRKTILVAMLLVFYASVYFALYHWISPPMFNAEQAISLCVLVPFSLWVGMAIQDNKAELVFALLGASVLFLFAFRVFSGEASLSAAGFQSLLPARAEGAQGNTGYQGLSLFAGFLPIYTLARLAERKRRILWLMGLLALSASPVFYIGGRSALVALLVTFVVWIFFNGLRGKRQCLIVILIMSAVLVLGVIGYQYLERAPLGVQRLLGLVGSDGHDNSKRLLLWGLAVKLWLMSPITMLIGNGPQQFPRLIGYDDPGMYPHNFILELLAEYGIIGAFLFWAPPLYLLVHATLRGGLEFRSKASFYFLFYYFIARMFMGGLQSIWPLFFFVGWLWADLATKGRLCSAGNSMVKGSE